MVQTNIDGVRQGESFEEGRVSYTRIDRMKNRTTAEAIFLSNGKIQFRQHDGWELNSWEFVPAVGEIRFVNQLRARERSHRTDRNVVELDELLAFEIIEIPDIFNNNLDLVKEMVLAALDASQLDAIEPPADLQELHRSGLQLRQQYLDLKRKVRAWAEQIEQVAAQSTTFEEVIAT